MPEIHVAIFSPHSLFREGLKRVLTKVDGLSLVGHADTIDKVEELAAAQTLDVIIAEQIENDPGWTEAITRMLSLPSVRVITVSLDEANMQIYRREQVGEASVEALIAALTEFKS